MRSHFIAEMKDKGGKDRRMAKINEIMSRSA